MCRCSFFSNYFHWSPTLHFDIGWVAYVIAARAGPPFAIMARGRRCEIRLLRDGESVLGRIERRSDIGEGADRLALHFTTADGTAVSGRGWDIGCGVIEGSAVPVFFEAGDPRDHVIACSCWYEAE